MRSGRQRPSSCVVPPGEHDHRAGHHASRGGAVPERTWHTSTGNSEVAQNRSPSVLQTPKRQFRHNGTIGIDAEDLARALGDGSSPPRLRARRIHSAWRRDGDCIVGVMPATVTAIRELLGLERCRLIAEIEDPRSARRRDQSHSDLLRYPGMPCRYDPMALSPPDIIRYMAIRSDWCSASPTSPVS